MTKAKPAAILLLSLHLVLLLHTAPVCLSMQRPDPARFFGHIPENSPAGTPVDGVLLPVGAGCCHSVDLTTSLKGDYASDFRLVLYVRKQPQNEELGLVSTRTLDREFIAMYQLTLELPPRCRRRPATVQVEVLDRNDNTPRFTGGNQSVDVDELTPLGTELARFDSKDSDAEMNGRVTVYASPGSDLLHVVPHTGQVRLVGSLLGFRVPRSARARRRSRDLSQELTYTVTVPDQARVGDPIFTVPDRRYKQRHFEVIPEADSPVQVERDSGRVYLTRSLHAPFVVFVRVQKLGGKTGVSTVSCARACEKSSQVTDRYSRALSQAHTHAYARTKCSLNINKPESTDV